MGREERRKLLLAPIVLNVIGSRAGWAGHAVTDDTGHQRRYHHRPNLSEYNTDDYTVED